MSEPTIVTIQNGKRLEVDCDRHLSNGEWKHVRLLYNLYDGKLDAVVKALQRNGYKAQIVDDAPAPVAVPHTLKTMTPDEAAAFVPASDAEIEVAFEKGRRARDAFLGRDPLVSDKKPFDGIAVEVIDGALVISGARGAIVEIDCDNVIESDTIKIIERDENRKAIAFLITNERVETMSTKCEKCDGHRSGTCCDCGYHGEAARHKETRENLAVTKIALGHAREALQEIARTNRLHSCSPDIAYQSASTESLIIAERFFMNNPEGKEEEAIKTQCAQDIFETAVRSAMEHGTMDPVDRLGLIRQALDVRFGKNPPKVET